MIYDLFLVGVGVVIGVVHHAYLHPRLKRVWQLIKAKAVQ